MNKSEIEQFVKIYAEKKDYEIERIANTKANSLSTEVYSILEKEIKKRNLSPNLLNRGFNKNKDVYLPYLIDYTKYVRDLPCPVCKNKYRKLNGTLTHTIKSFVFISTKKVKYNIACPDCLDKKSNKAMLTTFFLGWWNVPFGFIYTSIYLYRNLKSKNENHANEANTALLSFVSNNIGYIESNKEDSHKLAKIINT